MTLCLLLRKGQKGKKMKMQRIDAGSERLTKLHLALLCRPYED